MFSRPHHQRIARVLDALDAGKAGGPGGNPAQRWPRWLDDGVFSRDLIDLAMMKPPLGLLRNALAKAEAAYGASVPRDLERAIGRMRDRSGWLERCLQAMSMTMPPEQVWQRIRALRRVVPPSADAGEAFGRG